MVIGEITSSQQDIMFVQVRVEDAAFMETHNGTVKANYYINNSIGQKFTSMRWMGRIKIKIGNVNESSRLRLSLWDSPAKTKLFFENEYQLNPGSVVLHLSFNPLPAGDYYWELERLSGSVGISVVTDSTLLKAYIDGTPTTDFDIESKIMYVTDAEEERPVAVVGDTIDSGVTTISGGSELGKVMVGTVEKNISREGDSLANGGQILQGCWFVELES
ncbi:MAG: hypothetical protein KKD46_03415 [Euryarchaeota archaeon]|nr:hypothetical protein [Euryarchaeota archaeon]MBU4339949.1 hypothetical protein [Euryarchaeota archaeon]MBU4453691.1 hypothetical protein [Euryarchaeota archaeon]MCG2737749.1 hypothetical protein [Candidatus Methanoperedenaceae archaeon]